MWARGGPWWRPPAAIRATSPATSPQVRHSFALAWFCFTAVSPHLPREELHGGGLRGLEACVPGNHLAKSLGGDGLLLTKRWMEKAMWGCRIYPKLLQLSGKKDGDVVAQLICHGEIERTVPIKVPKRDRDREIACAEADRFAKGSVSPTPQDRDVLA